MTDSGMTQVLSVAETDATFDLSVLIPVTERMEDVVEVFHDYHNALTRSGVTFETIYIIDGDYPEVVTQLRSLKADYENLKLVVLPKSFGEAAAISLGSTTSFRFS